ncbi:MAG: DUF308 domain-containing protein [Christensenellales bacterium]|jgi:uncharacterized membrane protein HdeD (DUF308 family)
MKKREIGRLAVCLCFVAVGLVFLLLRERTLFLLVSAVGALLIGNGCYGVFLCLLGRREQGAGALLPPLITAALGVALLLGRVQVAALAPLVVGIWMLLLCAVKLVVALQYRDAQEPGWWTPLVGAALYGVFGALTVSDLMSSLTSLTVLIGAYLVAYGLLETGEFFALRRFRRGRER